MRPWQPPMSTYTSTSSSSDEPINFLRAEPACHRGDLSGSIYLFTNSNTLDDAVEAQPFSCRTARNKDRPWLYYPQSPLAIWQTNPLSDQDLCVGNAIWLWWCGWSDILETYDTPIQSSAAIQLYLSLSTNSFIQQEFSLLLLSNLLTYLIS